MLFTKKTELNFFRIINIKNFILNFGPQHPATHGVLRLVLELDGEYIDNVYAHIGFLHRGTEKLSEYKNYLQILPYLDRLDYVSTLSYEHVFSLAIEKLGNIFIDFNTSAIRVVFLELTRILNHLLAITTHAIDVGAATPFLWGFEEREKIMEILEEVCGARLHTSFIVPGGFLKPVSFSTISKIKNLTKRLFLTFSEIDNLLTNSRVWKQRLCNVGIINLKNALNWGFSGVMLRSCGMPWDLRSKNSYEIYSTIPFEVMQGSVGDCYDRYLVRLFELFQSLNIINFCCDFLLNFSELQSFSFSLHKKFPQNIWKKNTTSDSVFLSSDEIIGSLPIWSIDWSEFFDLIEQDFLLSTKNLIETFFLKIDKNTLSFLFSFFVKFLNFAKTKFNYTFFAFWDFWFQVAGENEKISLFGEVPFTDFIDFHKNYNSYFFSKKFESSFQHLFKNSSFFFSSFFFPNSLDVKISDYFLNLFFSGSFIYFFKNLLQQSNFLISFQKTIGFFLKNFYKEKLWFFFFNDNFNSYSNENISYRFSTPFEYSMESLIEHFLLNTEGLGIKGDVYVATECPKGEFGLYIRGSNFLNPLRFRLRAPGFFHLQALRFMSQGHQLSDLVTILGSIDLVLGEVDR